jgi:hypothetical protein
LQLIRNLSAASVVALLVLTACGSRAGGTPPTALARSSASPTGTPISTPPATASASLSASASPAPTAPGLSVDCKTGIAAQNLVLLGRESGGFLLYEVSDPVHPRLVCRIAGSAAHIVSAASIAYLKPVSSKTDVIVRALQNGAETRVATFPFSAQESPFASASWWPDGSLLAYTASVDNPGAGSNAQVWLYANHVLKPLASYPWPLSDCICRFGFPPQENALSADGQFVLSGWPVGKGAEPFVVSRVADRSQIRVFDLSVIQATWDRTGHRLFLIGQNGVQSWTPEAGVTALAGSKQWMFAPSLSPDGSQAVYTAYVDQAQTQLRVFLYDLRSATTRQLSGQPRTQVLFVKGGWVWYLDEATCQQGQPSCPPWGSSPSGKIYAQDLASAHETEVNFASGESPAITTDWSTLTLQDLWPRG